MTAVLRVDGPIEVDECLLWLPKERVEHVWRAGTSNRRGEIKKTSGFNLLLSDTETLPELVRDAKDAFLGVASRVEELVRKGATAKIDFALFVTSSASLSLSLDADTLSLIVERGVEVVVSAYPSCDDEAD